MTNHVEGKVIVITGAGSGFGRLVAERTAAMGAHVVGGDLSEEALAATTTGIRAAGGDATHLVADVTDKHQMDALARHAVDTHGRIDVLEIGRAHV